jgi:arylsulfatase A-like enzyme
VSDRRALLVVVPVLILASSACRGSSSGPDRQSAPPDPAVPRSLLIVTIDTLRADRIGAYGYAAGRTPAIDRLAARGVRFDRAFAPAPITLTSHASLLTGLYPPGHGARHNGMRVAPGVGTLAEILKAHGFATGAFVGAFPLDRRFGLDRGFDLYSDTMPRAPDGRVQNERPGDEVVDAARAWLANLAGREQSPFFLWLHLFEPHAPYVADPARGPAGRSLPASDRYDDEIARADGLVGRIVEVLGARAASTLVVFTSDHGEAFGEHGEIAHSVFVYDTTLRVPLIVAGPGIQAGLVAAGAVSLVDVVPTVLDLLKLPRHDTDGVSLRGTLAGEAPEIRGREVHRRSGIGALRCRGRSG